MRLALFGGSFDPPHRGHLGIAEAARRSFGLDRVLLAPAGRQPLKTTGAHASFGDRLAMCGLLAAGTPWLEASEIDAPRPDGESNYTIDTLRRLRTQVGPEPTLLVLVGADAFLDLRRWRDPDGLLAEAEWIVVSRPGFVFDPAERLGLSAAQCARVHELPGVEIPISATELRRRLAAGEDCTAELSPEVIAYIRAHRLYGA